MEPNAPSQTTCEPISMFKRTCERETTTSKLEPSKSKSACWR